MLTVACKTSMIYLALPIFSGSYHTSLLLICPNLASWLSFVFFEQSSSCFSTQLKSPFWEKPFLTTLSKESLPQLFHIPLNSISFSVISFPHEDVSCMWIRTFTYKYLYRRIPSTLHIVGHCSKKALNMCWTSWTSWRVTLIDVVIQPSLHCW